MLVIAVFMLAACSTSKQNVAVKTTDLTIEPLKLSSKEKTLISKTGLQFIQYYKLNGRLQKNEDLKLELVKYENGKNTGELMSTSDEPKNTFHNEILSFGTQLLQEEKELNVLMGIQSGISSTTQPVKNISVSSYGSVLNKKIKLIKGKPVYLAAWMGTSKNAISGNLEDAEGKFPNVMKQSELAVVYKITLVDRKK